MHNDELLPSGEKGAVRRYASHDLQFGYFFWASKKHSPELLMLKSKSAPKKTPSIYYCVIELLSEY